MEFIINDLKKDLSFKDKIILFFTKKYTYKIYEKGVKKGYDYTF